MSGPQSQSSVPGEMRFEEITDHSVPVGVSSSELVPGFPRRGREQRGFGVGVLRDANGIVNGKPESPVLAVPLEKVPE
ncbi:hypothetical protein [Streptomyces wuyuanensis]|uniref:hypothetical protein n=1 Tax=Streptomyces wuyuanensis TaxID=1196353 RepID=UPI003440168F